MAYELFRDHERRGWDARADVYADTTARATTQAIPALLGAVRSRVGLRTLDVSCGPGFAAGAAAAIGAEAEGLDFAPGMVREAARRFPACRFFEGDALAIDAPDGSYDAVICNFGVFHFTEPARAFAEAFRILRPGGRYAFSQWCAPAESPLFAAVFGAIRAKADLSIVPPSPDAFELSDRARCCEALEAAGFAEIEIAEVPSVLRTPRDGFFDFFQKLSVRLPIILEPQTAETVAAVAREIDARIAPWDREGALELPCPSFVVAGMKPA